MKQLRFIIAFFTVVALSSCLDIEENIVINKDNSGTYSFKIDMAKLGGMMAMMGAGKNADKPKEKADTVIYLKDYVDTSTALTADEKALFRDGFVKVKIDEATGEMNMGATCPFKNIKQLADIKNNLMTVVKKFDLMEKGMGKKPKKADASDEMGGMLGMDQSGSLSQADGLLDVTGAVFTAEPGKISSIIPNVAAFKEAMSKDSSMQNMQQMSALMGDGFNFKTVIVLPSKVKTYEGPGATLSEDKKTITYSYSLNDVMKEPEKISYKLEY